MSLLGLKIESSGKGRDHRLSQLDRLLIRAKSMMPIQRERLFRRVHETLKISVRSVKEQYGCLAGRDAALPEDATETNEQQINPALDHLQGITVMMVPRRVKDSGGTRWQATLITSARERFVLTEEELSARGWYCAGIDQLEAVATRVRFSAEAVKSFLDGTATGDLPTTYQEIRRTIQQTWT